MSQSTELALTHHHLHHNYRFTSTWWISSSLILGILCGLMFGEDAAALQILGDIYIGLLQMTVLPYILFALIANIGLLNHLEARLLARYGILLLFWLVGALTVWLVSLALPDMESDAFFSSLLIEAPLTMHFMDLFITANPRLLASTQILFSESYLDTNFAFVVPDHLRATFSDVDSINRLSVWQFVTTASTPGSVSSIFPIFRLMNWNQNLIFLQSNHSVTPRWSLLQRVVRRGPCSILVMSPSTRCPGKQAPLWLSLSPGMTSIWKNI